MLASIVKYGESVSDYRASLDHLVHERRGVGLKLPTKFAINSKKKGETKVNLGWGASIFVCNRRCHVSQPFTLLYILLVLCPIGI